MMLAVLQARMSSRRLPGKVMRPIIGKPMLQLQLERLRRARIPDALVVATSTDASDDPISRLCAALGVDCFRGALEDVLDRFYHACTPRHPDYVVRVTGDCPVLDPQHVDAVAQLVLSGFDYASNALVPTFPDGLDVEVFRFSCLEAAWREATLPSHRAHVTPFIYEHPERFSIGHYKGEKDLSHLRWTVDEPEDFELISVLYEALYPSKPDFDTEDILTLLEERPELKMLNVHHVRNEGYLESLAEDAEYRRQMGDC